MAKERSPNYPAVGLGEAIKALQLIWDEEKRTSVPIDVLSKAMGYNSVSGPVRTKVAAMRRYGLLDQNGGKYNISPLGVDILHGQPASHARALVNAALRPELFRELFTEYPDASDGALRSHLITKLKFSEAGAQQFIKAYRETLSVASPSKSGYIPPEAEDVDEDEELSDDRDGRTPPSEKPKQGKTLVFSWPLSNGVIAELKLTGQSQEVMADQFDELTMYLEVAKKVLTKTKLPGLAKDA